MTEEQQLMCVALLIAFSGDNQDMVGLLQAAAKRLLSTLPPEFVLKAKDTPVNP